MSSKPKYTFEPLGFDADKKVTAWHLVEKENTPEAAFPLNAKVSPKEVKGLRETCEAIVVLRMPQVVMVRMPKPKNIQFPPAPMSGPFLRGPGGRR